LIPDLKEFIVEDAGVKDMISGFSARSYGEENRFEVQNSLKTMEK